ncbi:MAG: hypothetical protein R8G66_13450 [Cytophagales bacterium]|nr:hypothetical protein [Cytophagales bacterium]
MTYQEKKSIASLSSTIVVILWYCLYVFVFNADRSAGPETDFQFYGVTILLIIPGMIVANILIHILVGIQHKMATNEDIESFEDEFDKAIELRANRNAYNTFMAIFLISMASLAMSYPPYIMLNILVDGMMAASLVWSISKLYFYRKGL